MRNTRVCALGLPVLSMPNESSAEKMVQTEKLHLEEYLTNAVADRPDVIVLPEGCDRPSEISPQKRMEFYAVKDDRIRRFVQEFCRQEGVNVIYSSHIREGEHFRNCSSFIDREGKIRGVYCKNHLVISEYTDTNILFGKEAPIVEMDFGKAAAAICFDLNFEELRKKYQQSQPELLFFSSMFHGGILQQQWAYEIGCYFAAAIPSTQNVPCNIVNPLGEIVATSSNYHPHFVTADVNLDYAVLHLDDHFEKLEKLRQKYGRGVKVHTVPYLGCTLVTSENETVSVKQMMEEFEMITVKQYLARSSQFRQEHLGK